MMRNVIDSHGGLHDRITHEMHIREFTLCEVESYLQNAGFTWDRLMVAQAYMVIGGVPLPKHLESMCDRACSHGLNHVNLVSTSVNLKQVANPLYIGVMST